MSPGWQQQLLPLCGYLYLATSPMHGCWLSLRFCLHHTKDLSWGHFLEVCGMAFTHSGCLGSYPVKWVNTTPSCLKLLPLWDSCSHDIYGVYNLAHEERTEDSKKGAYLAYARILHGPCQGSWRHEVEGGEEK